MSAELAPIAVDVMGADLGVAAVVDGAVKSVREHGIPCVLVGDSDKIERALKDRSAQSEAHLSIASATQVIEMNESPAAGIRNKPDASVRVAFELVKAGKASAVVSAGNTGAMLAAGLKVSGALAGIARPAIATLVPQLNNSHPAVLLDSGANVDCSAHQLVQFALMGKFYAEAAFAVQSPRVAILSNGSESSKGNDITRSASLEFSRIPSVNFVGYVEASDLSRGLADVIMCDGFVGNIALKSMEGSVELAFHYLRERIDASLLGRFAGWLARPFLRQLFEEKLDPASFGGAPLLGLNDIAIVCHGSASSRAVMNGIGLARKFVEQSLCCRIAEALSALDLDNELVESSESWIGRGVSREK